MAVFITLAIIGHQKSSFGPFGPQTPPMGLKKNRPWAPMGIHGFGWAWAPMGGYHRGLCFFHDGRHDVARERRPATHSYKDNE